MWLLHYKDQILKSISECEWDAIRSDLNQDNLEVRNI